MFKRFFGEAWAKCQTCGIDVPRSRIRYHHRFGWQCTGLPGLNCWDGAKQGDEYFYVPKPFEGIRRTSAPVTNTLLEGVGWAFQDQAVPSNYYDVLFMSTISLQQLGSQTVYDRGWIITGGYALVSSGAFIGQTAPVSGAVPAKQNGLVWTGSILTWNPV